MDRHQPRSYGFALSAIGVVALTVPAPVAAQTVRGKVAVIDIGDAIPKAAVMLLGENGAAHAVALTDSLGRFTLRADAPGRFFLQVHRLGYQKAVSGTLELTEGRTIDVRVNLKPDAFMLDAVTILGRAPQSRELREFVRRRQLKLVRWSFGREEIEQLHAGAVEDIVMQVPGAQIRGGLRNRRVTVNYRACPPLVYVDGFKQRGNFFDSPFPVSWIDAIEIFRTASETPAEYRDPVYEVARCGTILIWTVSMR